MAYPSADPNKAFQASLSTVVGPVLKSVGAAAACSLTVESFLGCEVLNSATQKIQRPARARFEITADLIEVGAFARLPRDAKRHLAAERNVASDCEKLTCLRATASEGSLSAIIRHGGLNYKKNLNYETDFSHGTSLTESESRIGHRMRFR
jgi:hypothetical protein